MDVLPVENVLFLLHPSPSSHSEFLIAASFPDTLSVSAFSILTEEFYGLEYQDHKLSEQTKRTKISVS